MNPFTTAMENDSDYDSTSSPKLPVSKENEKKVICAHSLNADQSCATSSMRAKSTTTMARNIAGVIEQPRQHAGLSCLELPATTVPASLKSVKSNLTRRKSSNTIEPRKFTHINKIDNKRRVQRAVTSSRSIQELQSLIYSEFKTQTLYTPDNEVTSTQSQESNLSGDLKVQTNPDHTRNITRWKSSSTLVSSHNIQCLKKPQRRASIVKPSDSDHLDYIIGGTERLHMSMAATMNCPTSPQRGVTRWKSSGPVLSPRKCSSKKPSRRDSIVQQTNLDLPMDITTSTQSQQDVQSPSRQNVARWNSSGNLAASMRIPSRRRSLVKRSGISDERRAFGIGESITKREIHGEDDSSSSNESISLFTASDQTSMASGDLSDWGIATVSPLKRPQQTKMLHERKTVLYRSMPNFGTDGFSERTGALRFNDSFCSLSSNNACYSLCEEASSVVTDCSTVCDDALPRSQDNTSISSGCLVSDKLALSCPHLLRSATRSDSIRWNENQNSVSTLPALPIRRGSVIEIQGVHERWHNDETSCADVDESSSPPVIPRRRRSITRRGKASPSSVCSNISGERQWYGYESNGNVEASVVEGKGLSRESKSVQEKKNCLHNGIPNEESLSPELAALLRSSLFLDQANQTRRAIHRSMSDDKYKRCGRSKSETASKRKGVARSVSERVSAVPSSLFIFHSNTPTRNSSFRMPLSRTVSMKSVSSTSDSGSVRSRFNKSESTAHLDSDFGISENEANAETEDDPSDSSSTSSNSCESTYSCQNSPNRHIRRAFQEVIKQLSSRSLMSMESRYSFVSQHTNISRSEHSFASNPDPRITWASTA